jgi:hypothetical protein
MTTTFFGRADARAMERKVYQLCSRAEDNRRRDIIAFAAGSYRRRSWSRPASHGEPSGIGFFEPSAACCGAIADAAPLIITESVMVEATKAAPTPAGDLRDAAVRTSEAVCCMTIPSVDTARFSREPPEEMRLLSHRDEGLNKSAGLRPSTALGLRRYRPCPNARQSGRPEP